LYQHFRKERLGLVVLKKISYFF